MARYTSVLGESTVLRINHRDVDDGRIFNWYISHYKALKFLVVISQFDYPMLISEVDNEKIGFQLYQFNEKDGNMEQLNNFDHNRNLYGSWEMTEARNNFGLLSCLEVTDNFDSQDTIARLRIEESTLTIEQFGFNATINYWKDKTSRHLFLDNNDTSFTCYQWEINWENDSVVELTNSFDDYNHFTFKRVFDCP